MDSLPFHLLEEILFKLNLKSLAIMQCVDKSINSLISNDPYFKSNVKGPIPKRSDDSSPDRYKSTPSLSSAMEIDEKVEVVKVGHDDKISPYAQNWLVKKKETRLGKRLLIEEDVATLERINKRRRVKSSYACN
ncbi:hypothetical protein Bca52824_032071 [Brassica carinata]|uniref:F-box domain-containing protein n=1 Tax=Brassica carinata TaxID=52824 RepID=A0A8X7V4T3_BRACI|nr:hypothetical protein Bca52824_032071 [Brassica carinata]